VTDQLDAGRSIRRAGHALLDAIRARCAELGYGMADLDRLAGTKRRFQ
jgi:hypothetical protein